MDRIIEVAQGLFWNVRGTFRVAGVVNVGTHASLVRLASGGFVLLDAYTFEGDVAREIRKLTDDGRQVEAILNLHPFHTVHVAAAAAQFPEAKLYGTRRHVAREPDLRWESLHTDDPELHAQFAEDFEFSVPAGVAFIPENENLHFASVIALHRASKVMHVDDTISWVNLPFIGGLKFHPTLRRVLHPRAGSAAEFWAWAEEFAVLCEGAEHLCTAHGPALPPDEIKGPAIAGAVRQAMTQIRGLVDKHQAKHG